MSNNTVAVSTILFLVVCATGTTYGGSVLINFEGFGNEGDPVSSIDVGGLTVEFDTERTTGLGDNSLPFIGEIGAPRVGFQSAPSDEMPKNADGTIYTEGGRFHLTDGLRQTHDYLMDFSLPVANLSLDLYDYRGDGPHVKADLVVDNVALVVFDSDGVEIASTTYALPEIREIDGNVVTLGVSANGIRSARLVFTGTEGGTAIDNIAFEFVPEPAGLSLAGFGLMGLLGLVRRGRRSV